MCYLWTLQNSCSSDFGIKITIYIGNTIRVSSIFVLAYRVKTSTLCTLVLSPILFICIWYWDDQLCWSVNRYMYFGHIFVTFFCQNMEIFIWNKNVSENWIDPNSWTTFHDSLCRNDVHGNYSKLSLSG